MDIVWIVKQVRRFKVMLDGMKARKKLIGTVMDVVDVDDDIEQNNKLCDYFMNLESSDNYEEEEFPFKFYSNIHMGAPDKKEIAAIQAEKFFRKKSEKNAKK